MSSNQVEEDIAEAEPYLEKSSGRKARLDKSAKARNKRELRNAKREREYEDGFAGNCN